MSKQTSLRRAIRSGDEAAFGQLMQQEGEAIDEAKQTPLHWAAAEGQVEIVRLLLTKFGADANATDSAGRTPLHMATINGHVEVARFLADKTIITKLNLRSTSEFRGFMFACAWFDPADNLWMFALILFVLRQQYW